MTLQIDKDIPLAERTTLELGGTAEFFTEVKSETQLIEALEWSEAEGCPIQVLGGGSNLVVGERVPGLTIAMGIRGRTIGPIGPEMAVVTAAAGEPWEDFVTWTTLQNLAGLECLAGIPGQAGSTPIQNVGAYGQDVSESIIAVRAIDRKTHKRAIFDSAACGFGYRDSFFKKNPGQYVVTSVSYALKRGGKPKLAYRELENAVTEFKRNHGIDPTVHAVRGIVLELRRKKSMLLEEGPNRRSAGSFFTNPIVTAEVAKSVEDKARSLGLVDEAHPMPQFPEKGGMVKLAAGWLIERAGFAKGTKRGAVGISTAHALALVHHGGGKTGELLALANEVRQDVKARFGVELHMEPVCWGCTPPWRQGSNGDDTSR